MDPESKRTEEMLDSIDVPVPVMNPEMARPEWLPYAITDAMRTLRLIKSGRVPNSIHGSMLRTSALRLLRCVYGSDEKTAEAVSLYIRMSAELNTAIQQKEKPLD